MANRNRSFQGACVLVAGATGVLGQAIARRLAAEGARLVLFGRDAVRLGELDVPGLRVVGDIADADACREAVWEAVRRYGRLDGVVNASGVVAFGSLEELEDDTIDELVSTNVLGPLRLMRVAVPEIEAGGFLANLSAVVAEAPVAGMSLYSATKAALSAIDVALARELRRRKIDVIDLQPPHTETGLASRPIAGEAPRLRTGLDPERVADRIVEALRAGERRVPAAAFDDPTSTPSLSPASDRISPRACSSFPSERAVSGVGREGARRAAATR